MAWFFDYKKKKKFIKTTIKSKPNFGSYCSRKEKRQLKQKCIF